MRITQRWSPASTTEGLRKKSSGIRVSVHRRSLVVSESVTGVSRAAKVSAAGAQAACEEGRAD
jgi:hypothetical protein